MKVKKLRGFMILPAVFMVILLGLLGVAFLQIYTGQFSALSANRKALQAQQFAQSEADFLRNVSYDELDTAAHARKAIDGTTGWMSEVTIDDETTVNEVQQRMALIKVYKNSSVTSPDFSLQVPLSSASSSGMKMPDWSKAELVLNCVNGDFIVQNDGYILALTYGYEAREYIYINDYLIANGGNWYGACCDYNFIPVSKGDFIKCRRVEGSNAHGAIYYVPFR